MYTPGNHHQDQGHERIHHCQFPGAPLESLPPSILVPGNHQLVFCSYRLTWILYKCNHTVYTFWGGVWCLSSSILFKDFMKESWKHNFERFIHVSIVHFFIAENYSIVQISHNLFTHSTVDGHWKLFPELPQHFWWKLINHINLGLFLNSLFCSTDPFIFFFF